MALQRPPSETNVDGRDARSAWRLSIGMAALGVVILIGLFWHTATSAIEIWWRQPTYTYAFLILPISAYLIWLKRHEAGAETPSGSLLGVAVTALFGFLWLICDLAAVTEGRHIAFVGMLQGILLACLGWRVFKVLSFPFLYLWLLVPTGSVLLPHLQEIATDISASILRWVGIPVYVEGFFIEVPSGHYHVEPGCAGLNFILATAALAPLYVYFFYRAAWKRIAAVVLAFLLAITMNGVRIAGVIALAEWSNQRLNIVDDHLLYGWGFFVLVLFAAGYVGSFFADSEPDVSANKPSNIFPSGRHRQIAAAGVLSVLIVVSVFVLDRSVTASEPPRSFVSLGAPSELHDWRSVSWSDDWSPVFSNADLQIRQSYARDDDRVDLFVAYYARQAKGHEMLAYENRIIDQTQWSLVLEQHRTVDFGAQSLPFAELVAVSGSQRRYIWLLYWVDGTFTSDPLVAKLLEAKAKLLFGDQRAAIVAVSMPAGDTPTNGEPVLQTFLEALPPIAALLDDPTRATQRSPVE
jgi:exosortase A